MAYDIDALAEVATTDQERKFVRALQTAKSGSKAGLAIGTTERNGRSILTKLNRKVKALPFERLKGHSTLRKYDPPKDDGTILEWEKTNVRFEEAQEILADMIRASNIKPIKPTPLSKSTASNELIPILGIGDAHLGLLAHHKRTRSEDWNLEIGLQRLTDTTNSLISKCKRAKEAVIVNIGDLTHANDHKDLTPKGGAPLETSNDIQECTEAAVNYLISTTILMLKKFDEVTIFNVPGNHDIDPARMLNICLRLAFKDEPRVKIIDNTTKVLTGTFGENFMVCTHGDRIANQALHNAITREFKKEHGNAKYTLALRGHTHVENVQVIGGIRYEVLSTLVPSDAWHSDHLYGSEREMSMLLLHRDGGLAGRHTENPTLRG